MLCNYDTDYFLESIESVKGRRYNVGLEEPIVNRNISKDDVGGFFKTLAVEEEEQEILRFVNYFQIAETDMIIWGTGIKFNRFKKIKENCILTGLLFENQIKTEEKEYFWYMLDTGGEYALEDMGENYNRLPFTLTIGQKYKNYVKSQFVFDVLEYCDLLGFYRIRSKKNGQIYNIELLEDVRISMASEYKLTIFLINRKTLEILNMDQYAKDLAKYLNHDGNRFFDINKKEFLHIVD